MATDFNSEFSRLFKNSCSVSGYDWSKPKFFDANSRCYDSEAALISSLTSEAFGKFGFSVDYYLKDISTNRDKLFGEDALENVIRRFKLNLYTDSVGNLQKAYQLQGMVYEDIIHASCSILHFEEASMYNYEGVIEYGIAVPKLGDIIKFNWNDTFYEIINIKTFAEGSSFLGKPITYEFIMKVWKNNHDDIDVEAINSDPMENLTQTMSLAETFNIEHNTSDITANITSESSVYSISGDALSINNSLSGKDKDFSEKSINDIIYKAEDFDNSVIFDPFEGF